MELKSILFSPSGAEASAATDGGRYDVARADLVAFLKKYFDFDADIDGATPDVIAALPPLYTADAGAKAALEALSEKLKAIKYAAYLLGIGDNSEKQLREKMRRKGFSPRIADAALYTLKKNGLVSDLRCGKRKCELLAAKYYGRRRILSELSRAGIAAPLCKRIVDEAEIDWEENLRTVYLKLTKGIFPETWEQKKKISDKLLRYGYLYDEIAALFDGFGEPDEPDESN